MTSVPQPLRLGTRGSRLALTQAEMVKAALVGAALPSRPVVVEIIVIKTLGDRLRGPLPEVADSLRRAVGTQGKGVFIKELEDALLGNRIDLAQHSLKDMPAELPAGLRLAAVLAREDPRDALVSRNGRRLASLPREAVVGTGSPRRKAMLLAARPDLKIVDLRGNVTTRLKKLENRATGLDAIVLATAGLSRLGLSHLISEHLPEDVMVPAPGQGIIAIETRAENVAVAAAINHPATFWMAQAERAFLAKIGGGCHAALGASAQIRGLTLRIVGAVLSVDGKKQLRGETSGPAAHAEKLGRDLAENLLQQGAGALLSTLAPEGGEGKPRARPPHRRHR